MSADHMETCKRDGCSLYGDCWIEHIAANTRDAIQSCVDSENAIAARLAAVTAERDALKASRWAGPWKRGDSARQGYSRESIYGDVAATAWRDTMGQFFWRSGSVDATGEAVSIGAAKAAADAALLAAGWWLA